MKRNMLKNKNSQGFTLAEVLITLGIIGVVAAMTIPTLVADYQKRTYDTAATTFERKLGEALKVMNSQQTLAGFDSTEDFVDELSKHFKITKTCANDKLMDCFEEEVSWGSGDTTPETVDMNTVKTSKNFGQKEWQETNVVGVQFASGVSALIAYNKDATQDPYSNEIVSITGSSNGKSGSVNLGTNALAILYDTNGGKSPNNSGKDLRSINVSKLGSGCFALVNDICIAMAPQVPTPHIWNGCNTNGSTTDPEDLAFMKEYGINKCMTSNYGTSDYWAGAVKQCGGKSKMPTMTQIAEIANYVYNTDKVGAKQDAYNLTYDTIKAAELGLPTPPPLFSLWSGEGETHIYADYRNFRDNSTDWNTNQRNSSNRLAICIDD